MTDNPEIRAKILDWQKRHNIQDGDPALALLELVQFVGSAAPPPEGAGSGTPPVSTEALAEAMKSGLLPAIERVGFQSQTFQQKLEHIDFDKFASQIQTYHEGIDYCTKKLDVIKKEMDAVTRKIEQTSAHIKPITRGAVLMLMIGSGLIGYIIHAITS